MEPLKSLILCVLVMLTVGCQPCEVQKTVVPQYVDVVSAAMQANTAQLRMVGDEVKSHTEMLVAIKDLVEAEKTTGADAPEASSPQQVLAPVAPTIYVSSIPGCAPCRQLKRDAEKGLFGQIRVIFVDDPNWQGGYPAIRWQEDGKWVHLMRPGNPGLSYGYDKSVPDMLKTRFGLR